MIPATHTHLYAAAITHPGIKGKNNEDRYAVSAYLISPEDNTPSLVAIVSDGIGGHRAGEVAAEMAVENISQKIAASDASQPEATLKEAFLQASQGIYRLAQDDPARRGMGATCVCAWVIGDRLYAAYVGDSRLYLVRGDSIQKLSTDHTWVQEAIDQGIVTPDQAHTHPNAHVIRRYLGSKQPVIPDLRLHLNAGESDEQAEANQGLQLLPNDRLLLCTDGLTDLVEDREILSLLKTDRIEEALGELVMLANQRGGHDNITLVALTVPEQEIIQPTAILSEETQPLVVLPAAAEPTQPIRVPQVAQVGRFKYNPRVMPIVLSCLGLGGIVLVALLVVGALGVFETHLAPTATPTITQTATITATAAVTPTPTQAELNSTATAPASGLPSPTYTPWPTSTNLPTFSPTPPAPG